MHVSWYCMFHVNGSNDKQDIISNILANVYYYIFLKCKIYISMILIQKTKYFNSFRMELQDQLTNSCLNYIILFVTHNHKQISLCSQPVVHTK